MRDCILLCACGEAELLPQNPDLPADTFTSCLTTPIKVALRWFCSRSLLRHEGITKELIDRIPGKQTDRKTPLGERGRRRRSSSRPPPQQQQPAATAWQRRRVLQTNPCQRRVVWSSFSRVWRAGELNWVFTAITDTIAWNVLPRALFQKLFRQVRGRLRGSVRSSAAARRLGGWAAGRAAAAMQQGPRPRCRHPRVCLPRLPRRTCWWPRCSATSCWPSASCAPPTATPSGARLRTAAGVAAAISQLLAGPRSHGSPPCRHALTDGAPVPAPPRSYPRLPPTHQHPMWQAWDMAAEMCLLQLPDLLSGDGTKEYQPSPFFRRGPAPPGPARPCRARAGLGGC